MALIYTSKNFLVLAANPPLVGRSDGGHIIIEPKNRIVDLQQLNGKKAIELMRLLMIIGEAMTKVLTKNEVDIGRINYQDNGNWGVFKQEGPYQHFHLYGRAKSAIQQKFGDACYFPNKETQPEFYKDLKPLNSMDINDLRREVLKLFTVDKYLDSNWSL